MNWIDSVIPWTAPKHSKLFDISRVLLGVFIFYKGVTFTQNSGILFDYLDIFLGQFTDYSGETFSQNSSNFQEISGSLNLIITVFLSFYLTTAHLIGGASLVLGFFTRWMCLMQIPILLAAVFLINLPIGFTSIANSIELGVSIIILIGLVYFFIKGAGEISIDYLRRRDMMQMENHMI